MITKEDKNKERFQLELEFVQMLSNPLYLHCNYLNIYKKIL